MSGKPQDDDDSPLHPWSGSKLPPLRIRAKGAYVIQNPLFNKGTAFSYPERDRFGLRGLLPPRRIAMNVQKQKVMANLKALSSDIERNVYLANVCDNNETLFHALLLEEIEYLAPIIYTPTVGLACQEFGYRFQRPRGMFISALDRGHMHAALANWPQPDVHVIVVTDGSRILGLGDLGAYGMGIPIGKLALYVAAGGIAPHRVMPVCLDVGTDNEGLLADPFYCGIKQNRIRGDEYFELVDEFLDAVRHKFPNAFVQFEDFSSDVAYDILKYYRNQQDTTRKPICVFNDDIQGTGAVTFAGLMSAMISRGDPAEKLTDERILIAGAGSAGMGVAHMILAGMVKMGATKEQAAQRFVVVDKEGPLHKDRSDHLTKQQKVFARDDLPLGASLLQVCASFKPTILMGLSAVGGIFTEEVVREVAKHVEHPFIFPLSNPNSKAECTAEQAYKWTNGKATFAAGSPFEPVTLEDGVTRYPSQCNNMFLFPGIGLAASVAKIERITDDMLYQASIACANAVKDSDRAQGRVYPHVNQIRRVSLEVATAVAKAAIDEGMSRVFTEKDIPNLETLIADKMYTPAYVPLVQRYPIPH